MQVINEVFIKIDLMLIYTIEFSFFITSPVILAISLVLSSAIYSQITLFLALNRVSFPVNEDETLSKSDFKLAWKPVQFIHELNYILP